MDTMGVDLHKRETQLCVGQADGTIIAPGSRQRSRLADCVSHQRRRHRDLGSLWESDSTDATERYRYVQEKAEALRQLGLGEGGSVHEQREEGPS